MITLLVLVVEEFYSICGRGRFSFHWEKGRIQLQLLATFALSPLLLAELRRAEVRIK